jgi:hypothetical protein
MLNSTLPYSPQLSAEFDAALLGRSDLSHAQPITPIWNSPIWTVPI